MKNRSNEIRSNEIRIRRELPVVILLLLIPKKVTITKIHHLIRLRFEQSEHKKSQCVSFLMAFDEISPSIQEYYIYAVAQV